MVIGKYNISHAYKCVCKIYYLDFNGFKNVLNHRHNLYVWSCYNISYKLWLISINNRYYYRILYKISEYQFVLY